MKKQIRILTGLMAAVMLSAVLAGCGANQTAATAPAAAPSAQTETTKAEETKAPETTAAPETAAAPATSAAAPETKAAPESAQGSETEVPEYVTITDHAGREVTVKTNPERVVIGDILPLPSVLTIFLNSPEAIVAMQPASMAAAKEGILSELYPEILNVSTDIMKGDEMNIEALLELEPDIVFTSSLAQETLQQLEDVGISTVVVSPTKWQYNCIETYDHWIELLSRIWPSNDFDSQRIHDLSTEKFDLIQDRVKDIPEEERKKVLFLFQYSDSKIVTSGRSFFGQWWCDAVGGRNAAESVAADNVNAVITMEQIYEWDPDVILITNFNPAQPEDLYTNAIGDYDWSTVKAVKEGQVFKMPLASYRTYTPGVDAPMTLEWMAQKVYPELFEEFDVAADVRDYYKELYGIDLTDEQIERMYHPNRDAGDITISKK